MWHLALSAPFKDMEKSYDIGIYICVRVLDAVTHPGLCREMHDYIIARFLEYPLHALTVHKIYLFKGKPLIWLELCEPVSLQVRIVVRIEVVDPEDSLAIIEQALREVEPDKTSDPGYQDIHCNSSRN